MDEPMVDPEFDEEDDKDEVGDVVDAPNPSIYEVGGPSTAIVAQPQLIDDLYREMDSLRERQGELTRTMMEVSDIWVEEPNSLQTTGTEMHCREGTLIRIMAPKQMTQTAIAKLVSEEVAKALATDRAIRNTIGAGGPGNVEGAGNAGGPERAQHARDCTFSSFMKCGPTQIYMVRKGLSNFALVENDRKYKDGAWTYGAEILRMEGKECSSKQEENGKGSNQGCNQGKSRFVTSVGTVSPCQHVIVSPRRKKQGTEECKWAMFIAVKDVDQGQAPNVGRRPADPQKLKAVKNWRFRSRQLEWGADEDEAFQKLKRDLCTAPILALPEGNVVAVALAGKFERNLLRVRYLVIVLTLQRSVPKDLLTGPTGAVKHDKCQSGNSGVDCKAYL
ncbi:hypothetical protein Tco_1539516 [Tanacetum coccineum]